MENADDQYNIAGFTGFPIPTLLILIWTTASVFWSIFTPPHRTFIARILLFQPAWFLRNLNGDDSVISDLALFLVLHSIYGYYAGKWTFIYPGALRDSIALKLDDDSIQTYVRVFTLLGGCGVIAGVGLLRGGQLSSKAKDDRHLFEQSIGESWLPPLLLPSRTNHSRVFPQKHSFSYSYLFVGIPIGVKGRVGNVLAVDSNKSAWFNVQADNYLDRSNASLTLSEKLNSYLQSQGIKDRDYAFAYLVTAPRFLGYSFNPVSFWYIYDEDTELKYMILEVNNTFGERRMYLLKADAKAAVDPETVIDGAPTMRTVAFTNTWTKDFHVSPFNSRKGSYSLRAIDPLAALGETNQVRIDNTIVLRSSDGHPKIVARVFTTGEPTEPSQVSVTQLTQFLATWWWVGLATLPRIVWEAQKLFLSKRLHLFNRPEVTGTSIGRSYTDDEWELEDHFRAFLTHAVEASRKPLRVIYEPAHNERREIVLYSGGYRAQDGAENTLTIKVVTPAFYSRYVHYAGAQEAFDRESLTTHEKSRTVILENAHLLPVLLSAMREVDEMAQLRRTKSSAFEKLRWSMIKRLRCPPALASFPPSVETESSERYSVQDIRASRLSELDRFVLQYCKSTAAMYRQIVIKAFLSERIGFGIPGAVMATDWLFRMGLLLLCMIYCDATDVYDVLRPREFTNADYWTGGAALVLANAIHIWSFVKG